MFHFAPEEGSKLRGIILTSMSKTHAAHLQVTIGQFAAYASKHHNRKFDLMAVGMPRKTPAYSKLIRISLPSRTSA